MIQCAFLALTFVTGQVVSNPLDRPHVPAVVAPDKASTAPPADAALPVAPPPKENGGNGGSSTARKSRSPSAGCRRGCVRP